MVVVWAQEMRYQWGSVGDTARDGTVVGCKAEYHGVEKRQLVVVVFY